MWRVLVIGGSGPSLHRLKELFYSKLISDPVLKTLFHLRRPIT